MMDAKRDLHMESVYRERHPTPRLQALTGFFAMIAATALAGCGGGSGAATTVTPTSTPPPVTGYTGPPPATPDVQSFMVNVWNNIKADNRCGGACHGTGQVPMFARNDDINLAYGEANTVANLSSPIDSRLVQKVGGGHNCWLTSPQACADILTTWIELWAGDAIAGGGRTIQLTAPPIIDPSDSKTFPASSAAFGATVHPLLTQFCSGCHASDSTTLQAPFFADSDVNAAYEAVKSKIDLDDPAASRLVVRLRDEFHNCWTTCPPDANTMEAVIASFANGIQPTQLDPTLIASKALTLYDGTIAAGGNRYEANQIALWEFKAGLGATAFDTSGVNPALNLSFSGAVEWVGGWGINIRSGKAQGSTAASKKLHDLIMATNEYSIEAWAAPGNVVQEEARIISYSAGQTDRNFTLQQTMYNYEAANRSSVSDANGAPMLATAAADEDLQATLQHVVLTYDPVNGRRIYVNGVFTDDIDGASPSILSGWDDTYAFVLGNEVSNDGQWVGVIRLVAIHNRALTPAQIVQNFDVGVGEKYFMLFSVEHLINVPQSYIMFEAAQYDSYSYLFNEPTFISLDATAQPNNIPIQAVRIGVNGAEAAAGQAYANMDETVTNAQYTVDGQQLTDLGTVIGLEKGPASDQFFLTFDVIGTNVNNRVEPPPAPLPPPADSAPVSDIGVRTFDEINVTLSTMTTVSTQDAGVRSTFLTVRQSLPAVETIEAFLSAHEMAIAQLSIAYCSALVDDTALRSAYFPSFATNFSTAANLAFDTAQERDAVLDPLVANMLGNNVNSGPTVAGFKGELNNLIDRLIACGGSCAANRTEIVVKSVCAAAAGSGAMLVQ